MALSTSIFTFRLLVDVYSKQVGVSYHLFIGDFLVARIGFKLHYILLGGPGFTTSLNSVNWVTIIGNRTW